MVVRDCTMDNGGVTKDVEIGALDHCGWMRDIKYDNQDMKGCLIVCETDGCNGSGSFASLTSLTLLLAAFALLSNNSS